MWVTFTNIQTQPWRKSSKSSASTNSWKKIKQQLGVQLQAVLLLSNSTNNLTTIVALPAPSITVWGADAIITLEWLALNTRLIIPLISMIRTSLTLSRGRSLNNAPGAIIGCRETTDVLRWLANADNSFVMTAEGLPALMGCVLIREKFLSLLLCQLLGPCVLLRGK